MIRLLIFTLVLLIVNLFVGNIDIPFLDVVATLMGDAPSADVELIVLQSRLPEALVALFAGGALAISGLVMQTIFSNPLADPSLLGVNAGASLGVAIAVLLLGGSFSTGMVHLSGRLLILTAAFLGAMLVIALLTLCSHILQGRLQLLVTGVMLSFMIAATISILNFFAAAQSVQTFVVWGLGSFSGINIDFLPIFVSSIVIGTIGLLLHAKSLNALLLGEDYARNLGIHVQRSRTLLLALVGFLTAVITAFCGPISFIGLAVPHALRFFFHTANHRILLPACFLGGSCVALFCNLLARSVSDYSVLPVNTLTPLIGVPVVLFILLRRR